MSQYMPLSMDERLNALTHAVGLVLSGIGLIFLLLEAQRLGGELAIFACLVYGTSLMLLYTTSTLYHLSRKPQIKSFWRRCDHVAIFLLIAGSYTPFCLLVRPSPEARDLLQVVWILAGIGSLLKIFYAGRLSWLSTLLYLGLGWILVWKWDLILDGLDPLLRSWLLAGGLLYSVGTLFYLWKSLRFHHAYWHLCVLGGSLCHFLAVFLFFREG